MRSTRRQFINAVTFGGASIALTPIYVTKGLAAHGSTSRTPGTTGERMAAAEGSFYRAYCSRSSAMAQAATWAQIDLGSSQPIDAVKLYPSKTHTLSGEGFPLRFRIECSDDPEFKVGRLIVNYTRMDYPESDDRIIQFRVNRINARYVRVTATRLRSRKVPPLILENAPKSVVEAAQRAVATSHVFALAKIEVLSNGSDIALHQQVAVDSDLGNPADAQQLTRSVRPYGEGIVTDRPQNVTAPGQWRPVSYRANAPSGRVQLGEGLFTSAMQNAIGYLLDSYTVDDLLRQFRLRAGFAAAGVARSVFWEDTLAGSNAGRFLMGAGNILQWQEHGELRSRLNAVVEGIAQCRQDNGYIMAYPEDTFFVSERGAYARAWLTHGLLNAGYAGNPKAFELLRGYYDWYNTRPYLKEMLRGAIQGGQGMVANTRLYFTPMGKPEDIQVLQRYFQETYWLEDLAARKLEAVWQYPYDRPHSYLLTNLEAYLDLYRATGDERYLSAVLGAWEMYRENWQSIGGSFFIIELAPNKPKSYPLYDAHGETCGSAFWILLSHRLHLLDPEQEKYVTEIEKSIYNVLLANQDGIQGIRYHTLLVGHKEASQRVNTCCEGQATRLIGNLPQFIYSTADDGLYVNLFESSSIEWELAGETVRVEMQTSFPKSAAVRLKMQPRKAVQAKIRIRTPSWATQVMNIEVNEERVATGAPGTYVTLHRTWSPGDEISFVLPMDFKLTKYTGADRIEGRDRFSLEYGPLLMAVVGQPAETELVLNVASNALDLLDRLEPLKDRPLRFVLSTPFGSGPQFVPYFELNDELFSCVPFIDVRAGVVP